jgi:hypothetical protein
VHLRGACFVARRLGLGYAIAAAYLLLLFACAETRQFLPGVPLLLVPLIKEVDDRGVGLPEILVCGVAGVATSKIWLDASVEPIMWQHPLVRQMFHQMPQQLYYMNIGVTMGHDAYRWHLMGLAATVAALAAARWWRTRHPVTGTPTTTARWERGIAIAAIAGVGASLVPAIVAAIGPRSLARSAVVATPDGPDTGAWLVNGLVEKERDPNPERDDPWATIDLGKVARVVGVRMYGLAGLARLEVDTSVDGVTFSPASSEMCFLNLIVPTRPSWEAREARYVRVTRRGRGTFVPTEVEVLGRW